MKDESSARILAVAIERVSAGDDLEEVLASLRSQGVSQIHCIMVVRGGTELSLAEAKRVVHESRAFADVRQQNEAVHRDLTEGLVQAAETMEAARDGAMHEPEPARELGELRAWLTVTLRLAHRTPGPAGLTVISVPSDRELIDEVQRLRELADATEAAREQ